MASWKPELRRRTNCHKLVDHARTRWHYAPALKQTSMQLQQLGVTGHTPAVVTVLHPAEEVRSNPAACQGTE
jgi:hypothetical protein